MTMQKTSFYVVLARASMSEVRSTKEFLGRTFTTMRNVFKIDRLELYAVVSFSQYRSNTTVNEVAEKASKAAKS